MGTSTVRAQRRTGLGNTNGLATFAIGTALLVCFYYQSYRYPFRIGDSQTSPTYVDTPPTLQIGKYALLALMLAIALTIATLDGRNRAKLHQDPHIGTSIALLLLGFFGVAKGVLQGTTDLVSFSLLVLLGAGFASLTQRWRPNYRTLAGIIGFYAVICVLFDAVQVILFRTQGRLPSLAYENSISVRFGAVLDDPNGYGILITLLLPVVIVGWSGHKFWRFIFSAGLLATLVATQSFTAITAGLLSLVFGYLILRWRDANQVLLICFGAAVAALAVWAYTSTSPVFQEVLGTKVGSFNDHAKSVNALDAINLDSWIGIGQPATFIESGYVYLLANFGLIFTAAYACIGLAALPRLYRVIRSSSDRATVAVHCGAYFYVLTYLASAINLNVINTFPNNFVYILAILLSMFPPANDETPPRESAQKRTREGALVTQGRP